MKATKIASFLKITLLLCIVVMIGLAVYRISHSPAPSHITIKEAKIKEVRAMAQLCAMEIYEDVPIRAHIGSRHLFARQKLQGSINFDIEKLNLFESEDTLTITLPPETVEVYESTLPEAYNVIDTWNTKFLGSDKFTAEEENSIKAKAKRQWIRRQYAKGTVRRARAEAAVTLREMLTAIYKKPVKVIDPTPNGLYYTSPPNDKTAPLFNETILNNVNSRKILPINYVI